MNADLENMSREQLLLLAKQLKSEAGSQQAKPAEPALVPSFKKRGKTVVIVDDSRLMHIRFKSIVTPMGFEVVGNAENGAVGVEQVLKHLPALVLLDYQMPVMDGEQTAREIRKHDSEVKIIVVSGTLDMPIATALLGAGVSDILVKPIDVQKFTASLEHIGFDLSNGD